MNFDVRIRSIIGRSGARITTHKVEPFPFSAPTLHEVVRAVEDAARAVSFWCAVGVHVGRLVASGSTVQIERWRGAVRVAASRSQTVYSVDLHEYDRPEAAQRGLVDLARALDESA